MKKLIFIANFIATAAFSAMLSSPMPELGIGGVDAGLVVDVISKMDVEIAKNEWEAKGTSYGAAISYGIAENMHVTGRLVYRDVEFTREFLGMKAKIETKKGIGFGLGFGGVIYEHQMGRVGGGIQLERFSADAKVGTGEIKWMEYQAFLATTLEGMMEGAPVTPYIGAYINKVDGEGIGDIKEEKIFGILLGARISPATAPVQVNLQARLLSETSFACSITAPLR